MVFVEVFEQMRLFLVELSKAVDDRSWPVLHTVFARLCGISKRIFSIEVYGLASDVLKFVYEHVNHHQ